MIPKFLFQIWLVGVGIMCGPVIVIFIITIQITSNWPQYNDGLSQTCCFFWSCQMWLPLWCFGKRKKKEICFWRDSFGSKLESRDWWGYKFICVCVCLYLYLFKRKRTREKAKLREKEYVRVFVCVPAIIQQLFMLTCVYVWCVCAFSCLCVPIPTCDCVYVLPWVLWAFTAEKFNFSCHSPISLPNSCLDLSVVCLCACVCLRVCTV